MNREEAINLLSSLGGALGKRLATNIRQDRYVPRRVLQLLDDEIAPLDKNLYSSNNIDTLIKVVREVFTKSLELRVPPPFKFNSALPVGPIILELDDALFGRLITLNQLVELWQPAFPGAPKNHVKDFIRALERQPFFSTQKTARSFEECPLGIYINWSTFNQHDYKLDPFDNSAAAANLIAATLGLDALCLFGDDYFDRVEAGTLQDPQCVLIRFKLPPGFAAHVPTCVEAYAGTGRLNYYFSATDFDIDIAKRVFPRTMPIPAKQEELGYPEIVHSAISAAFITEKLEFKLFSTTVL